MPFPRVCCAGCNLVCTATHLSLTRLIDLHFDGRDDDYKIEHLHCQLDNCVGENKNNYFISYMASLVAKGVVRVAEIHFMMVGHTHVKIDQIFSR